MSNRRTTIRLTLSLLMALALGVGVEGTAHAAISDPPGFTHLPNIGSQMCAMADADTGNVAQWQCLNAHSEQWKRIPQFIAGGPYYQYQSNWTFLCMAVPNWPVEGTGVVQAPCDASDVRQYWRERDVPKFQSRFFIDSLQGALCLTVPDGSHRQGLQLEMWGCRGLTEQMWLRM
jgi:hypothetical protein